MKREELVSSEIPLDTNGNRLEIKNGIIFLHLVAESFKREIGRYIAGTFYKKENKNGVFKKLNAFGFCYQAIKLLDPQQIIVDYKRHRYRIKRQVFERERDFLHFKEIGIELRVYIPLNKFERKKIEECK